MRNVFCFLLIWFLHLGLYAQSWIGSPSMATTPPAVTIEESTQNQIRFVVAFHGFYSTEIQENGQIFQRISMPGCGFFGEIGQAELPILKKMVAVPESAMAHVSFNIKQSETLSNYNIYPNPSYATEELSDGISYPIETFAINSDFYSQNTNIPSSHGVYSQDGYFRSQRFIEVTLYPFRYNPALREVLFAKEIEVTITFDSPQSPLQRNTGIFNKVASSAFINYETDGKSAIENDMVLSRGTTTYMSGNVANNLPQSSDYLVIYDDMFSVNQEPHDEIKRLCEHRAFYNGFDVAAVSIKDVLNSFTSNTTTYINETKLKNFIRSFYKNSSAKRTLDGKLGYVLLIGKPLSKTLADTDNTKVPTSFIHETIAHYDSDAYFDINNFCASDYFLSCVSGSDSIGDLFIGRFSVTNRDELYNLVEKTINTEILYNPIAQKNILYAAGKGGNSLHLHNMFQDITTGYMLNSILCYSFPTSAIDSIIDCLNKGTHHFYFSAHGIPTMWSIAPGQGLSIDMLKARLNNTSAQGLCTSLSCSSAMPDSTIRSLGEVLTTYAPNKGFSAFLGASRGTDFHLDISNAQTPTRFYEYLPYSLYHDLSSIVGEILLSSIINTNTVDTYSKFNFNLLGDPALNIMAHGMEVSNCITLPQNTTISSPLTIKAGGCLKIPENGVLHFANKGSIQVMPGGVLEIGSRAKISGEAIDSRASISIFGEGLTIGSQVEISNIDRVSLFLTHSVMPKFQFRNVKFNNAPLYATKCIVDIDSCSFENRSDIVSNNCDLTVAKSEFVRSGITTFKPIGIDPIPGLSARTIITDNTFSGTGSYTYHITNTPGLTTTSNAAIKLDNVPEYYLSDNEISNCDEALVLNNSGTRENRLHNITRNVIRNCRIGSTLYNSYGLYNRNKVCNNHIGVRLFNNSCFYFNNTPVVNEEDKQELVANSSHQLYSSNGTFPLNFRYNSVQGGNTTPWIYNDTYTSRYINVSNNHWGDNEQFEPDQVFNMPDLFIWTPFWDGLPTGKSSNNTPEEAEFQMALSLIDCGDYLSARTALRAIIESYSESDFATAALKELFRIESICDNDYAGLKSYLKSNPTITASANLHPTADFLSARCDVVCKDYQSAIDWYENRLSGEISYQDSIFAVIDLGDIYWNIQLDSLSKANPELHLLSTEQSKSFESHQNVKDRLLSTLPKQTESIMTLLADNNSGVCTSRIVSVTPNPAKADVTITYYTDSPALSEIKIYGANGSLVDMPRRPKHLSEGYYAIRIDISHLNSGLYLVTLQIDQKNVDTEKLLIK